MPRDPSRTRAGGTAAAAPLPTTFEPQLATLVKEAPEGDAWVHELKYDGYRIGCRVEGDRALLLSRRGKDWTAAFPEVCAAVGRLGVRQALLDGEVAVVLADGRTSFQALQNVFGGGAGRRAGMAYFLFDLLHLDGRDLRGLPLEERKAILTSVIAGGRGAPVIRYSEHVVGNGRAFFSHACRMGLEGIISKQRTLPYTGGRTTSWVKTKCIKRQEMVIGGFTDPEGSRSGIGALLVGMNDARGRLAFAGKVGTGFSHKVALDLRRRLDALEQKSCPFDPPPTGWMRGHAHWVRPVLVAEVQFGEMTEDGKVRHASFQGLRADKTAKEVVAEKPVEVVAEEVPATRVRAAARTGSSDGSRVEVAGISLSNPDRMMYPDLEVTKLGLARFYENIAEWIVPHVKGRPLTLVRCPKGMVDPDGCQYMKHSGVWAPPALRRVHIPEKKKVGEYLVADHLAGVVALVQMDVLEIHTWNSLAGPDIERPNRLVFDLDPGPDVQWGAVITAARLLRDTLAALGLESFVKTTGGRGLHVVVPLVPERPVDECLAFSRNLSAAIARRDPESYTVAVPKAGRERKILIDYLRNNRTNTSVAAFSTRARPAAPVSVPITWEELSPRLASDHFTMTTLPRRLARLRRDPWASYWKSKQRLTAAILAAAADVD
jgi:bifunctional non-homologous end joining protein LigD